MPPKSRTKKAAVPRKTAPNALAAEATNSNLGFDFRGHRFVIDLATVDFGRAMFAMQVAKRQTNPAVQFERLFDCLESVLGEEQVATLYEVAPDVFSSETAQQEFWEQFTRLTVGASLGEPSAS